MNTPQQNWASAGFAIGFLLASCFCILIWRPWLSLEERGIHTAPSGQAVYIAGEAITINSTYFRSRQELENDCRWAVTKWDSERYLNLTNK